MIPVDGSDRDRLGGAPEATAELLLDGDASSEPEIPPSEFGEIQPEYRAWLQRWYRYVDSQSRPTRRGVSTGPEEDSGGWRPWRPSEPVTELDDDTPVRAESIPDLAAVVSGLAHPEIAHRATGDYEDPTIYDELRPIPQFQAPTLTAPRFELEAPRFPTAEAPVPDHPSGPPEATGSPEPVSASGDSAEMPPANDSPPADPDPAVLFPQRYHEVLAGLRAQEGSAAGRAHLREGREELLQRLLDPLLSLEETARLLGVCPTTVRRYTNKGVLKHLRTQGNQRRFRLSDVMEFLESRSGEIEADARADLAAGRGPDS